MPQWSNSIPKDPRGHGFPILRTPIARPLRAIVTSADLIGTYTHYYHGRTIPHDCNGCAACKEGLPYRWHAYVSAFNINNGLHFIFECTAQAAEAFVEYRDRYNSLRGCYFEAVRLNRKPNGRVTIKTRPQDLTSMTLPSPPDLVSCLCVLWNLPITEMNTERREPEKKTRQIFHRSKGD